MRRRPRPSSIVIDRGLRGQLVERSKTTKESRIRNKIYRNHPTGYTETLTLPASSLPKTVIQMLATLG
jgi:hypothetical protein